MNLHYRKRLHHTVSLMYSTTYLLFSVQYILSYRESHSILGATNFMLEILPIMLCHTAQNYYLLCSKLIILNVYVSVPMFC